MSELWTEYDVTWEFTRKLCGSVPGNEQQLKDALENRKPKVKPPGGKTIPEIHEEIIATLEEPDEEISVNVFQKVDGGLVVRSDNVRSHFKECAKIITQHYVGYVQGEKSLTVRAKNCVYFDYVEFIPILRPNGDKVTEPDDRKYKPIHTIDFRGRPINAIKVFDWIEAPRMEFGMKVMGGAVKYDDLKTIFQYGGVHGFGGERSAGEGKYVATIILKEEKHGKAKSQYSRKKAA